MAPGRLSRLGAGTAKAVCVEPCICLKWLCREDGAHMGPRTVPSSELLAQPRTQQVQVRTWAVSKERRGERLWYFRGLGDAS